MPSENKYFQEALSNFTAEAAYAGAVRHLHNLGLSIKEIKKELLYPVSTEKIEKVIQDYEKEKQSADTSSRFILETDKYGRKSFRKVNHP